MKKYYFLKLFITLLFILFISNCKKEEPLKLPVLTTSPINNITYNSASTGGTITSDGGAPITARGVCWSVNQNPIISDSIISDSIGVGTFNSTIMGLQFGTTYYVRAYATNSVGTSYGSQVNFTTLSTVTDIDGNVYHIIKIGSQIRLSENLKVTKYRNGDPIPLITNNTEWTNLTTGAYSNYNNDLDKVTTYGRLYNWFTATDSRKITPAGWHIPTHSEWEALINYLGGTDIAGGKLKETGTLHWNTPNTGATNESGFLALPGGCRWGTNGIYDRIYLYGHWWTATEYDATYAWLFYLNNSNTSSILGYGTKRSGYSIRCIKD